MNKTSTARDFLNSIIQQAGTLSQMSDETLTKHFDAIRQVDQQLDDVVFDIEDDDPEPPAAVAKTLHGPRGVKLILDPAEVFPDDPGQGTPAIVDYKGGTATYWCAIGEGVVDRRSHDLAIPQDVLDWLDSPEVVAEVEALGA